MVMLLVLGVTVVFGEGKAQAADEYAWVLVDTRTWANSAEGAPSGEWSPEETRRLDELFKYHELTGPHDYIRYYAKVGERSIEYQSKQWQGEPPGIVHVIYTWTAPPSIIKDREVVTINLNQEIKSNFTAHYYLSRMLGCEARVDTRDLTGPGHVSYFQGTFPDGTDAQTGGRGALSPKFEHQSYKQNVSSMELSRAFGDQYKAAREGDKRSIEVKIVGWGSQIGKRYTYEYKKLSSVAPPQPASHISINIDNKPLQTDVPPIIREGRTLVPLRAIFEALGMEVEYIAQTRTIIGSKGESIVQLTVDSTQATVNGKAATLDVPAMVIDGRTLVPVRFIAESTGQGVAWDGATQRVSITTK